MRGTRCPGSGQAPAGQRSLTSDTDRVGRCSSCGRWLTLRYRYQDGSYVISTHTQQSRYEVAHEEVESVSS